MDEGVTSIAPAAPRGPGRVGGPRHRRPELARSGYRLIGLRRVDAHNGGVVTVRSALIAMCFDEVWNLAMSLPFRPRMERYPPGLRALASQLSAIEARTATIQEHTSER